MDRRLQSHADSFRTNGTNISNIITGLDNKLFIRTQHKEADATKHTISDSMTDWILYFRIQNVTNSSRYDWIQMYEYWHSLAPYLRSKKKNVWYLQEKNLMP
jgi:hypothetical protein